ncbi:hypothetical protein PCANC_14604 [Puccinia coronata f. sp. avenae]|uniref:Uncharacterized protein n=1 Tax=Puccinia coronata f. sp. avenae TaxID=200324 RepID=A0A2N5UG83_9BASI|nr:hypothetical protein PCANC_14604 [Puccinia coronata f. sp. avenae]
MPLSVNPKLEARCKLQQTTGQYPRQLVAADHIKRSFMKNTNLRVFVKHVFDASIRIVIDAPAKQARL